MAGIMVSYPFASSLPLSCAFIETVCVFCTSCSVHFGSVLSRNIFPFRINFSNINLTFIYSFACSFLVHPSILTEMSQHIETVGTVYRTLWNSISVEYSMCTPEVCSRHLSVSLAIVSLLLIWFSHRSEASTIQWTRSKPKCESTANSPMTWIVCYHSQKSTEFN